MPASGPGAARAGAALAGRDGTAAAGAWRCAGAKAALCPAGRLGRLALRPSSWSGGCSPRNGGCERCGPAGASGREPSSRWRRLAERRSGKGSPASRRAGDACGDAAGARRPVWRSPRCSSRSRPAGRGASRCRGSCRCPPPACCGRSSVRPGWARLAGFAGRLSSAAPARPGGGSFGCCTCCRVCSRAFCASAAVGRFRGALPLPRTGWRRGRVSSVRGSASSAGRRGRARRVRWVMELGIGSWGRRTGWAEGRWPMSRLSFPRSPFCSSSCRR